jgi:hypothetical protein
LHNYFNPPEEKSPPSEQGQTNSSSNTPTDIWSSYLHSLPNAGTHHVSQGTGSDDSRRMGTSSGEMVPLIAGEVDVVTHVTKVCRPHSCYFLSYFLCFPFLFF